MGLGDLRSPGIRGREGRIDMMELTYALTYYAVLCWNALPDQVHLNLFGHMDLVWSFLRYIGYVVYEDGSVGW